MMNDKKLFSLIHSKKHMLWIFDAGGSNKYPQRMFLGELNTVFLNTSNYLPLHELRNRSIQTVVVTNFYVISNVGIMRFDCIVEFLY